MSGQPDHPLHGHLLPHRPRVLSPLRLGGEGITSELPLTIYRSNGPGQPLHQHPALAHRVLPPVGGDHPPDLPRGPPPRQVCPLHHDPGHLQVIVIVTIIITPCTEKRIMCTFFYSILQGVPQLSSHFVSVFLTSSINPNCKSWGSFEKDRHKNF